MSTSKFAETHNLVAFLEKPEESNGFKEIIDFLNTSSVQYALTINPTIYTTCIEQFWTSAKVKTVNGERQIQALVDKKKVIITETSIRSDLKLDDAEGTDFKKDTDGKDNGSLQILLRAINAEHGATPSCDPPQSGKDRMQLTELIDLCTQLKSRVLALETTKSNQALEIESLKRRVKSLEKRRKSRTPGFTLSYGKAGLAYAE
ncbi:hypothetical protein Tco_0606316 [Tanacetum coccineum]